MTVTGRLLLPLRAIDAPFRRLWGKLTDHPDLVVDALLRATEILILSRAYADADRLRAALRILREQLGEGFFRAEELLRVMSLDEQYRATLPVNPETSIAYAQLICELLPWRPVVSLVIPVESATGWLDPLLASCRAQVYPHWEVLLAPTGAPPAVPPDDPRVRLLPAVETRGEAVAAALRAASGHFVAVLQPGVLAPDALFEAVRAVQSARDTDLVYTDEDRLDEHGARGEPFLKPDWSPELLLATMYTGGLSVLRRERVEELGGPHAELGHAVEYDLQLRLAEQRASVVHVQRVLFTAVGPLPSSPRFADAIAAALARRGLRGTVSPLPRPAAYRVRYELAERPPVSIVMSTAGKMHLLAPCLDSILKRSTYPNYRILLIDNSTSTEVAALHASLARQCDRIRYTESGFRGRPFNFSAIQNRGVRAVDAPFLVLLNDDTKVIEPGWIEAMLEHAQRPSVGATGVKLLYANGTLQHAGYVTSLNNGGGGHACRRMPGDWSHRTALVDLVHECAAVTFACAMVRRAVYDEIGGFDELRLPVLFNDIDFCLRARERGYQVLYTPHALLYHLESASRTLHFGPGELEYMKRRWGGLLSIDPFYPPALRQTGDEFSFMSTNLDRRIT